MVALALARGLLGALPGRPAPPQLAATPKDEVQREGTARLYRFRATTELAGPPLLLVPSMINRWYVLDLRPGASMAQELVARGVDTFVFDWGEAQDEDRFLSWDDVLRRLGRAVRTVKRVTGAEKVAILGYCMGGTLSAIHTALFPHDVAGLVNLLGPVDFASGGLLRALVDASHFDVDAIADAGNVAPRQMQSGFVALRPSIDLAKVVGLLDRHDQEESLASFAALEAWASDNVPFPADAYRTYIASLYQKNELALGAHRALGRTVDLGAITCPVLTIASDGDTICPPSAARALNEKVGGWDHELFVVKGGHVGAVVGGRARDVLHPKIADFVRRL